MTNYRDKILQLAEKYYKELENDFSHDINHVFRVERLVKRIGEEGSRIARGVLAKIGFPEKKIGEVCHAILVHRKSKDRVPETLEAKILQDADYLDALGAIDVARVIASSLQSKKYKRPIYTGTPSTSYDDNKSAINYILYKIAHPRMQPANFHTRFGRQMAKERYAFVEEFARRFIAEWEGKE